MQIKSYETIDGADFGHRVINKSNSSTDCFVCFLKSEIRKMLSSPC